MSGYVDVKLPNVSTRGFTTWKIWKKQWCILRPNSVKNGILIILRSSAGMSSTSQIEIPKGSILSRTSSKTKDYAFGIYPSMNSHRSLVLLAGQSESESQLWMSRIRTMLNGKERNDSNYQNDQFNISIIDNEFSNMCGFKGLHGKIKINDENIEFFDVDDLRIVFLRFCDINNFELVCNSTKSVDNERIFLVKTNSNFLHGQGQLFFFSLTAKILTDIFKNTISESSPNIVLRKLNRRISRSEGTLFTMTDLRTNSSDSERDSGLSSCEPLSTKSNSRWYYPLPDPSFRISVNNDGIVLKGKRASTLVTAGMLLSSSNQQKDQQRRNNISVDDLIGLNHPFNSSVSCGDNRFSEVSAGSGFYEEISEQVLENNETQIDQFQFDDTYEILVESIYGTTRRRSKKNTPPPLPPRKVKNSRKLDRTIDSGLYDEYSFSTHHNEFEEKNCAIHSSVGSLNSLPQFLYDSESSKKPSKSLSKFNLAFGAFRKRVQSDSQSNKLKYSDKNLSCKCDTISEHSGNSHNLQKRFFDFSLTPSKSKNILRNSKMSKAFRKFGGSNNFDDLQNSTKSCESLNVENPSETSFTKRCSKSEENLDVQTNDLSADQSLNSFDSSLKWYNEEGAKDLSLICTESNFKNSYPDDILDLILKGKTKLIEQKLRQRAAEEVYVLMSPNSLTKDSTSKSQDTNIISPKNPSITENNYMVMKSA